MPTISLKDLSNELGEPFEGDGSTLLQGVAEITTAKQGDLSFVANPKYVSKIPQTSASALIVPKDLETAFRPLIRSDNPYLTFTKALHWFHKQQRPTSGGIHPESQIATTARLGADVTIMAHAMIEDGAVLGDRVVIYPGVFVGAGARIGDDVTLYPHVSVYAGCEIQNLSIIHAGARIGAVSGMTYEEGKAPVFIGADVELGANVVVSGDPVRTTSIGEGSKIDNLVQVGPGSSIGPHCIIVAQVSLGAGVEIGERVTIAGQVVVSENVKIGARSRIGAQSVVTGDVPPDSDYWGAPAQPHSQEKRQKVNLARLPRLFDKLKEIEEKLSGKS